MFSKCLDLTDTQWQSWAFNSNLYDYKIPQVAISYADSFTLSHLSPGFYLVATGFVIFTFLFKTLASFLLVDYLNQYQGCFAVSLFLPESTWVVLAEQVISTNN